MAFDNVTLFEVNLPNEVFGSGRGDETGVEIQERDRSGKADQSSGGRSKGKLLFALVALAGIAFGVRKLRSGGDEEGDIEMAYEEPGVEVEQTQP